MQNSHQMTQTQTCNRRERSVSPRSFNNRIKSAQPLNIDRENVMQENLLLKTQLNKIQKDIISNKKEINSLENELIEKDKFIEEMMNESNLVDTQQSNKIKENHLIINLKKQYKELRKDYEKLQKDNEVLKKNIKITKLNELSSENKILSEQVEKLKNLYEHSISQTKAIEHNIQDYNILKEALAKQDFIILNFQQNFQKMSEDISNLNSEIERIDKLKNDKEDANKKLKQKLKLQYQLNEKLVMTNKNIKQSDEYIQMKNKYETKIQKLRKDLAYYRDSNAKNEKLLREAKQFNINNNNLNVVSSNINHVDSAQNKNPIINSNPMPRIQQEPPEQNGKILLLQSKFMEEKKKREKLEKEVEDLTDQLSKVKKTETKVILQNSFTNNDLNLNKTITVTEYDYFSDYAMNEFIYILLKNLEANKIDMSIIESRVLCKETMDLLQDENKYKEFITTVSTTLCDILKIQQEKDQKDIHSFVKTFLFNYFISKKNKNPQPEEFKNKLLSLFDNIMFYSIEQKQELNKIISTKITPLQDELVKVLKYFDENETGFITFTTLKKVMEELQIKLKNEPLEYFIYVMKSFNETGHYLKDLKYDNLLKVLKDTPIDPNDHPVSPEEEKEKEDSDDDAIEITNEEYLNKVKEIIGKICKILVKNKKPLDDYFLKIVSKSIKDYRAIRLIHLVETLKSEFNIELSHLEIFCLFTKVKPGDSLNKENDDDNIEEIIDYDKLKREVENYLRNPPKENEKNKDSKTSFNNNFNNGKSGDYPMNKVAYSDMLENNNFTTTHKHTTINNISSGQKNAVEKEDNPKIMISNYLKMNKISYERFVFPIHCMMKIASNGKKFNRYIDVEIFKHLLVQNNILIYTDDLMKFLNKEKILFNDGRVNIDYLKFIISGQKGIRDNKMNDFMVYKPYKCNFGKNDENEKNKDTQKKNNNDKNKKNNNDNKSEVYEESESIRMLQKEIYGDDDGEIEEIKTTNKI